MSHTKHIFVGTIVAPVSMSDVSITPDGYLAIHEGKIIGKGSSVELQQQMARGEWSDYNLMKLSESQFLVPGFVDCHTHAPQFPNIGLGLDRPLLEWLDRYTFPLEKQYDDTVFASKVYDKVVRKLIDCGTTTACYFGSISLAGSLELVNSAMRYKQRALVGKVSMNIPNDAQYYNCTKKEIEENILFIENVLKLKSDLVLPIVSPRFALSCDRGLLIDLAKIASKYKCRIQSHISENNKEIELVLKDNPDCESYSEVYDKAGILNEKCIMAHAVLLSDSEARLLASRGVSVAHCPASNTRLQSGLCPVRKLLDANITVGLGTDVSGGDSPSIMDAMRRAMDVSVHLQLVTGKKSSLNWKEVLYLATLGGAKALNLDDKIGSFEIGKEFDALLVDVHANDSPIDKYEAWTTRTPEEYATELVQRFVYLGDDRNITRVFVKGNDIKATN